MSGGIGQPVSRLEGPAKVTGRARYTAGLPVDGLLHAVIVPSTVPSGVVVAIDATAAERSPGVIRVFTHRSTPRFVSLTNPPAGESVLPLQDDRVLYEGQAVALVVADTLERATEAARLVRVTYRVEPFATSLLVGLDPAEARPLFGMPPDASVGDVRAVWATAAVTVDAISLTADRHHNPMEPSVSNWAGPIRPLRERAIHGSGARLGDVRQVRASLRASHDD
jgi:xanthine dehydrogenase YagR molybdenum-binding subunit